jgi:hypothetical protein
VAEWLGEGLQNPLQRFNSAPRLEDCRDDRMWPSGRLAQGESASLTRKRSEVQILYRPPKPVTALTP